MNISILRGLPGAGKTSWAKDNFPLHRILSADKYHEINGQYVFQPNRLAEFHQLILKTYCEMCRSETTGVLCVDNTNIKAVDFAPFYKIGEAYGHTVEMVEFHVSIDVAYKRGTHNVPYDTVVKMYTNWCRTPPYWNRRVIEDGKEVESRMTVVA